MIEDAAGSEGFRARVATLRRAQDRAAAWTMSRRIALSFFAASMPAPAVFCAIHGFRVEWLSVLPIAATVGAAIGGLIGPRYRRAGAGERQLWILLAALCSLAVLAAAVLGPLLAAGATFEASSLMFGFLAELLVAPVLVLLLLHFLVRDVFGESEARDGRFRAADLREPRYSLPGPSSPEG